MSLESSLLIANGAIYNISTQLGVVSHNVANASTAGYAEETSTQTSLDADGIGMGVKTGVTIRTVNNAIQSDLFSQNATVSDLEITQSTLAPVDASLGTVAQGDDISSLLGTLEGGFSTLSSDPSNVAQQSQVVSQAQMLAAGITTLSATYTSARQSAQDDLVAAVGTLNTALANIGSLTDQIIQEGNAGLSVADLENERDAQFTTVSSLLNVRFISQSNGDVLVETADGLTLPIHDAATTLTTSNEIIGPNDPTGSVVTLNGTDITSQLLGGRIGADITLRDTTLPTYQAELDEFAYTLSTRFSNAGLTLFTKPDGTIPSAINSSSAVQANYVGYAAEIGVNPAVVSNPSLVRDGNNTITNATEPTTSGLDPATGGAVSTAAFTPNPTGDAGFTGLISNILNYTFGADAYSDGSETLPWSTINTSGLGPNGNLSAPYATPTTLSDFASVLVSAQAQTIGNNTTQLTNEQSLQSTLQTQLSSGSGVSIDNEMSNMLQLQNAYGANAKIIAAVQTLFADILAMVQ
jgi:flagellar hook-associated protein 1 FlgK